MTYHLIDTENIPIKWIQLLESEENDEVLLFRLGDSNNKNYISFDDLVNINNKNLSIDIIECFHGKPKMNALDFQLSSYLGFLICNHPHDKFIIYSNDTGFEPMIEFWKTNSINIKRICEEDKNGK